MSSTASEGNGFSFRDGAPAGQPGSAAETDMPDQPTKASAPLTPLTVILAVLIAAGITLVLNLIAAVVLRKSMLPGDIEPGSDAFDSFYDGCVALFTLAVPAFLGGLALARLAGARALVVSFAAFGLLAAVGLWHPYWQVPPISSRSVHNAGMHYMLYNPLVMLAFGTFGSWLGGEFTTGRFMLDDREPVHIPGMEED